MKIGTLAEFFILFHINAEQYDPIIFEDAILKFKMATAEKDILPYLGF